jgi:hypothetical protein
VSPGGRPAYLTDHGAAAEEIGWLRWTLTQVIALADDAPGLTDEQLRDRLLALAGPGTPSQRVLHRNGSSGPRAPHQTRYSQRKLCPVELRGLGERRLDEHRALGELHCQRKHQPSE